MNKGIVIITTNYNKEQLIQCIQSLQSMHYPILIYTNDYNNSSYEGGALKYAIEHTTWEEILLVQDTIEFKKPSILNDIFDNSDSVYVMKNGFCYLNKYKREVVNKIGLPVTTTKQEAVNEETNYHKRYSEATKVVTLFPELIDCDKREEKFGRTNMVIENEYVKKYKGCWSPEMIK